MLSPLHQTRLADDLFLHKRGSEADPRYQAEAIVRDSAARFIAVEIGDLFRKPKRALAACILVTPTLIMLAPLTVRRIVGTLSLDELTGGEVDSVVDLEGRTFLLPHAQTRLRHSEAVKQTAILNALPAHIALLDTQGLIISVNESWRPFADANVLHGPGHGIGLNYLDNGRSPRARPARWPPATAAGLPGSRPTSRFPQRPCLARTSSGFKPAAASAGRSQW